MTPKKVFIAGHSGLVGSATLHALRERGCYDLITCSHERLDLEDRKATYVFLMRSQPDYVVMCAAKVGGILANTTYPVDFLHKNLRIQLNVFDAVSSFPASWEWSQLLPRSWYCRTICL